MRIIALQGRGGTGKTTTLKRLIDIIMENGKEFSNIELEDIGEGKDWRCWFSCKGVKIGITTRGDAEECLYADFFGKSKNFRDRNIVVCAIRTHGGTVDFIEKHGNDGRLIHGRWYLEGTQDIDSRRSNTHKAQAEAILADIKAYINEMEASQ